MAKKTTRAKSAQAGAPSLAVGLGCLMLFALPFAAVGVGVTAVIVHDLWTWQAAQRWVETPATLLASELVTEVDDDGATYSVTARYAYEVNGKRYENDGVAIHGGSDNVGSYHQERAAELERVAQAGGQTVCYVNPDDPTEALLFRDLRPGMIAFKLMFAVVFGGVGFGLLGLSVMGYGRAKREESAKKSSPEKAWLWREDWAAGRIRSSDGQIAWFITFFAVCWNVLTWPIFFMVWNDAKPGGPPILLLALFPAAGVFVGTWAVYLWLRRFRWGVSEFEMAAVPGVLGGPLAGVIHAPRSVVPADGGFVLRLACSKREHSGSESTQDKAVWESEQTILRDLTIQGGGTADGAGTLIPVKFMVPYDLPPTDEDVKWQLEVRAETIGVDYFASFDVPMFKTAASSPMVLEPEEADSTPDESLEALDFATTIARMNAVLEDDRPASRMIRFPIARNRGLAAFLVLFALAGTAACYGLFVSGAPRIFPWTLTFIDVFIVYATVRACFGSTILEYNSGGVAYSHRTFGIGRRHDVMRTNITGIDVDKSGTTYGDKAFRKVVLSTDDGSRTIASEIPRKIDAERLAADIRRVLGLETVTPLPLESDLPSDFLRKTD